MMKTNNIFITKHAMERASQRFNRSTKRSFKIEGLILGIVGCGKEIKPKDSLHHLLNHGFNEFKYYLHKGRVITVYNYDKSKFYVL